MTAWNGPPEPALDRLSRIAAAPISSWRELKASTGRPVVGCLPMYVPEELIHAAGITPVTITGCVGSTPRSDSCMPSFACSLVRGCLELALSGKLDMCDGFVFPYICDSTQALFEVWKTKVQASFLHHLVLPSRLDTPAARRYLIAELARFRTAIEQWTGQPISSQALQESIALYENNRLLLGRLDAMRWAGTLTGREMLAAVNAGFAMAKADHSRLLEDVLNEVEKRKPDAAVKLRIAIAGLLLPGPHILDLIESSGGMVVADDMFNGARYYAGSRPVGPDPLESLADRFLSMMPCTSKHDPARQWADHVAHSAQLARVDGVVVLLMKYCDTLAFDYPELKSRLDQAKIPHLLVETDQDDAGLGQLKTRLEAFFEMLRGV